MKFSKPSLEPSLERAAVNSALRSVATGETASDRMIKALKRAELIEEVDGKLSLTEQGHIQMMFASAR